MLTAVKQAIEFEFPRWRLTLLGIFLVALLIRVLFILTLQDGYYFPDSVSYSDAAVNLLTNGELGKTYNRPPGYPVFLAGIYLILGESILAVRIAESFMGALLGVLLAQIGRRVGGNIVGALAGALWTVYPIGVFITGLVYPTNLLATLLVCGIFCLLPDLSQDLSTKRAFLAGTLLGLATLTKPIVLITIAAVSTWLIYWNRSRVIIALLFGAALIILPWIIRDFYAYDRLVLVEPRAVQHLPLMSTADGSYRNNRVEALLQYPAEYGLRIVHEFYNFWSLYPERITMDSPGFRDKRHQQQPRVVQNTIFTSNYLIKAVSILTTGPIFLLAIIGMFSMWFRPERRYALSLLSTIILSFAVGYSFFYSKLRYRIPIEPYIIVLSAFGLTKMWDFLATRFHYITQPNAKMKAKTDVDLTEAN